jgi:hypothetical protein
MLAVKWSGMHRRPLAIITRPPELTVTADSPASSAEAALQTATSAFLGRFKGASRAHAASDLRVFLSWCATRHLDPLTLHRAHLELYVRWLQETRHFMPVTVSRRVSVLAEFYRTAVIDAVLEQSPATGPPGTSPMPMRWPARVVSRSVTRYTQT